MVLFKSINRLYELGEVLCMAISKAWDWNKELCPIWLQPSEESYFVAQKWKDKNIKKVLDFGWD